MGLHNLFAMIMNSRKDGRVGSTGVPIWKVISTLSTFLACKKRCTNVDGWGKNGVQGWPG